MENHTSTSRILQPGVTQGSVLSPLLYLTTPCFAKRGANFIIQFTANTTAVGVIKNPDESAHRQEIKLL